MNKLVFLLFFSVCCFAYADSRTDEFVERVDLLEVNHYYDENGAHLLDQILFYEWDAKEAIYQVRAWRLLKVATQYPKSINEGYETKWREGASQRRVISKKFRETWTQYDPELLERRNLPREERRELFQK